MPGDKEGFAGIGLESCAHHVISATLSSDRSQGCSYLCQDIWHLCILRLLEEDHHDLYVPGLACSSPLMPSPSIWKKGPHLPSQLLQETHSLEVRGLWQLLPWGPATQCGVLHHVGEGEGESQAFPVYVTHRPSRKGKGLESALLLGRLQRELRIASLQEVLANPNSTPGCVGIQLLHQPEAGAAEFGSREGKLEQTPKEVRHGSYSIPYICVGLGNARCGGMRRGSVHITQHLTRMAPALSTQKDCKNLPCHLGPHPAGCLWKLWWYMEGNKVPGVLAPLPLALSLALVRSAPLLSDCQLWIPLVALGNAKCGLRGELCRPTSSSPPLEGTSQ